MKLGLLVLVLIASGPLPTARAAPPTADDIVKGVEAFYAKRTQVTASFEQVVTNPTFGTKEPSAGTVLAERPGKMRWDYAAKRKGGKPRKAFIADGKNVYYVDHVNKSVTVAPIDQSAMPAAIGFLVGTSTLATDFTAAIDTSGTYARKGTTVVALTPKKPSAAYKQLYLVVDPTDFHVVETVIVDSNDGVNQIGLLLPDYKTAIGKQQFVFDAKLYKGYKIIKPTAAPTAQPKPLKQSTP